MEKDLKFGREIVEILRENGVNLDATLSNKVILKTYEAYEAGKEDGFIDGVEQTCKEFEIKISSTRSKLAK